MCCCSIFTLSKIVAFEQALCLAEGAKNCEGDSKGEMEEPSSYPVIVAMTTHLFGS